MTTKLPVPTLPYIPIAQRYQQMCLFLEIEALPEEQMLLEKAHEALAMNFLAPKDQAILQHLCEEVWLNLDMLLIWRPLARAVEQGEIHSDKRIFRKGTHIFQGVEKMVNEHTMAYGVAFDDAIFNLDNATF